MNLSGKLFSWSRNVGVSEASNLCFPIDSHPPESLAVQSHRTGKVITFNHVRTDEVGDGGTVYVYEGHSSSGNITLHVYED